MQKKTCKSILLFGGGIDSVCLLSYCRELTNLTLLHIDYGQKAFIGENSSMKFFAEMFNRKHNTIRTDIFNSFNSPLLNKKMALNHSQNYLPLRNQVLLTLATMYAVKNNYKDIYVGFHVEPVNSVYYDAMSSFLKEYNSLIKSQKLSVKVVAPLIELTQIESIIKTDVINLINKSFSCYESKTKKECGKCTHCIHKKQITEEVRNSN